jgi:RNA polymerase sigma-70 factor (ECF subfamily)
MPFDLRSRDDAIERHVPALRRFARSLERDKDRADDLVQECLVRALSAWPTLRSRNRLHSWLFSILYNAFLMHTRQSKRQDALLPLDSVDPPDQASDQASALGAADLLRAVDCLSEEHRVVLLLVAVEDMSYAEAADSLGIPIGTVMSRLSRAREQLRNILGGQNIVPLRRTK